jgi:hypothetical protein
VDCGRQAHDEGLPALYFRKLLPVLALRGLGDIRLQEVARLTWD